MPTSPLHKTSEEYIVVSIKYFKEFTCFIVCLSAGFALIDLYRPSIILSLPTSNRYTRVHR
jgi:hypothetical protein